MPGNSKYTFIKIMRQHPFLPRLVHKPVIPKIVIAKTRDELKATLSKMLVEQIPHFDRGKLKQQPVWYANTNYSWENTLFPYHGYLVSGKPYPRLPDDGGKIFNFVIDVMHINYDVTPRLVAGAQQLPIQPLLKTAIRQLQGNRYLATEHFLMDLERVYREYDTTTEIPADDIRLIVTLKEKYNDKLGSYAPLYAPTNVSKKELALFETGYTVNWNASVSALTLVEILHEQKLYLDYLDSRLGIGKAQTDEEKEWRLTYLTPERAAAITNRLVEHRELRPSGYHQGNCNSSAATFLQYAKNREARQNPLHYQNAATATWFAYAKNHRMFIHDPMLLQACVDELKAYRDKRAAYGDNSWGKFFASPNRQLKLKAVDKMIDHLLQRKEAKEFTVAEIAALSKGKLGGIIAKYPLALEKISGKPKQDLTNVVIPSV